MQTGAASPLPIDPVLILTTIFFSLTVIFALAYFSRIRRAASAYEEAKNAVEDIIISFDKQLHRQAEVSEASAQKIQALAMGTERMSDRLRDHENTLAKALVDFNSRIAGSSDLDGLKEDMENLKTQVEQVANAREQSKLQAPTTATELQIETAIPIRRERALAPLTDTELHVLEFIADGGEKTAPEVKEMIKLTREHTARLMKKLYEEGYLERRPEKIPYTYRVKEEMVKILKKSEANA